MTGANLKLVDRHLVDLQVNRETGEKNEQNEDIIYKKVYSDCNERI